MNLSRLVNTDFTLLAERGAQEARKWLERSHRGKYPSRFPRGHFTSRF